MDRATIETLVRNALVKRLGGNGDAPAPTLVVNSSARHMHISQEDLETLFGPGYKLNVHKMLYQDGQFAAKETVTLIGPRKRMIPNLRILGPTRKQSQIELAFTDAVSWEFRTFRRACRANSTARRALTSWDRKGFWN